jgi:hypothetical protein
MRAAVNPYVRQIGIVTLCESLQNKETKHTGQQLELQKSVEDPRRKEFEQNLCNAREILSTAKLDPATSYAGMKESSNGSVPSAPTVCRTWPYRYHVTPT